MTAEPPIPDQGGKPSEDPRFGAALDLLRRSGMTSFRLHFTEEEQPPVAWVACGAWTRGEGEVWEAGAAMHPTVAVFRLCEQVMDGGTCTHCHRPTGFSEDTDPLPIDALVCWYQWDPELATFRRGCEGGV